MNNSISSKQVGTLLFFSIIAIKAVLLPAIIYFYAGTNGYITVIGVLTIDFSLLLCYLAIMKRYPNKTFVNIMEECFGLVISKVLVAMILVYFAIKTILMIMSTYNFLEQVLYDEINWIYYVIVTLAFLYFVVSKSLRVFGRSGQVLFWIVFFAITLVMLITVTNTDFTALLPLFPNGAKPLVDTGFKCAVGFGDYTILIFFLGNTAYTKHSTRHIITFALLGITTIANFYIVFLCNFGYSVVNQNLAIADLTLYIDLAVSVSRLEWIAVFSWLITMVVQMSVYAYCFNQSLIYLLPQKISKHSHLILVIITGLTLIFGNFTLQNIASFVLSQGYSIFACVVQIGIPLLLLLCLLIYRIRKPHSNPPALPTNKQAIEEGQK